MDVNGPNPNNRRQANDLDRQLLKLFGEHMPEGKVLKVTPSAPRLSEEQLELLHAEQDVRDDMTVYGKSEIADRLVSVLSDIDVDDPNLLDEFLGVLNLSNDFPLNKLSEVLEKQLVPGADVNEEARFFLEILLGQLINNSIDDGDIVAVNSLTEILDSYDIPAPRQANISIDGYVNLQAGKLIEKKKAA